MNNYKQFFIEPENNINPETRQPASYIRKSFVTTKPLAKALLNITALGVYEGYLNGKKLGKQTLTPGYTDYNYRVQYQSHDVTENITVGENIIAAVVGDGRYRGALGIGSHRNVYGEKLKFLCVLQLEYTDGSTETLHTDASWRATQNGPLRENDLKVIECFDARQNMAGWAAPGFDDSLWHNSTLSPYSGNVVAQKCEEILEHEKLSCSLLHTPNGGTVLDFGQNMAGRVSFNVSGPAGHTVTLLMGETLDEKGNFTQKNLVAEGSSLISGELGQKIEYTLASGQQSYKPIFSISGFRYVLLENWPEKPEAEKFSAHAVYTALPQTGSFECSNPLINKLVQNVRWSQKSNFVDVPTDCPTRERSGWTGDISVFGETACWLTNPSKFLEKWLEDFMLEQKQDGNLPYVVPEGATKNRAYGCAGWSDAIANLPITLYNFYGDKNILDKVYTATQRFVEFNLQRAKKKNIFLFFKTGKHRQYIIETGFHYGEWLEPGKAMYKDYFKALLFPDTEVTTAWFYNTVKQLAEMGHILGKSDASKYETLAAEIRLAYKKEFLKNGRVKSKRQCRFVRPLAMNLASEKDKPAIAADLNHMCIENNYKIGTGFLTTYKVLAVLSEHGYADTAYKMLENTSMPSWFYPITKGATTTWENWFGLDQKNVPLDSHNHYATGSVVAWLFGTCAGITPQKPGFEEILIKPIPGGSLTWAKAEYKSCRGTISSAWKIENKQFTLDVIIPQNTPATVVLPNGQRHIVSGGKHSFSCPA